MPAIRRKHIPSKGAASPEAIALRRIMHSADPHTLISTDLSTLLLPSSALSPERTHFVFYQDEGGLRATDERNGEMELIYYLGVIDVLTPYSGLKKIEHFWKGLSADRVSVFSCFWDACECGLC